MSEQKSAQVVDFEQLLKFFSEFKTQDVENNFKKLFKDDYSRLIISQFEHIATRSKMIFDNLKQINYNSHDAKDLHEKMTSLISLLQKTSPFESYDAFHSSLFAVFIALGILTSEIESPSRN
jgi:hypothetical protein